MSRESSCVHTRCTQWGFERIEETLVHGYDYDHEIDEIGMKQKACVIVC